MPNHNCAGEEGHYTNRLFGFERNVFFLGLVSFFTDVSSEMIYPLLPLFITKVLGAGIMFLGIIEGVAESTASILKLFSGWLSDFIRKRKLLIIIGYSLSAVTRPLVAVAAAAWQILVIRFIDRTGKGIRTAPRDALISHSCGENERGKSFGFHRSMDHAGAVVGPLIAFLILLATPDNYRFVFWMAFVPGFFSILVIAFLVREKKFKEEGGKAALSLRGFDRNFKFFLVIIVLFTLGNSSDAFLLVRAERCGIPPAQLPLIWIFLHIVKMLTTTPGGMLSDRVSRKIVIICGWLIYSAVYIGFAFADRACHIWMLFGLYGVFYGLTEGVEKALIADIVPAEARGTAYGIYNFAIGIGALPASVIMGGIWQAFGVSHAFIFGAILSFIACVLIGFLKFRR